MKRGSAKLRAMLRRKRFLRWYLTGPPDVAMHATRAVLAANLTKNENSAGVYATHFLADPEVQAEIVKYAGAMDQETERLLRELRAIAYSRHTDLARWDNGRHVLTPSRLLTDSQVASVQAVEMVETATENGPNRKVRVQQYNKLKALELIALITSKLIVRHEVSGPGGKPIRHQHEHVVFYLPTPTRLREPLALADGAGTDARRATNGHPPNANDAPPDAKGEEQA